MRYVELSTAQEIVWTVHRLCARIELRKNLIDYAFPLFGMYGRYGTATGHRRACTDYGARISPPRVGIPYP